MNTPSFKTLTETLNYLEERHHKIVHRGLRAMYDLVREVAAWEDPNLQQQLLKPLFHFCKVLKLELDHHMTMEEEIVFPLIRNLETAQKADLPPSGRGLANYYLKHLVHEHEVILHTLHQIRQLSADYQLPFNAPPGLKELYDQIRFLHSDLDEHLHFESTYLFPQVDKLEAGKYE